MTIASIQSSCAIQKTSSYFAWNLYKALKRGLNK